MIGDWVALIVIGLFVLWVGYEMFIKPRPAPPNYNVGRCSVKVTFTDLATQEYPFVGTAAWSDAFGMMPCTARNYAQEFINDPDPIDLPDIGLIPRSRVHLYEIINEQEHVVQARRI